MSSELGHYFIRRRNKILGPFELHQLERMRRRGQIGRIDEYSTDGTSWRKLSEFEQLFVSTKAKPPRKTDIVVADFEIDDQSDGGDIRLTPSSGAGEAAWYYCSNEEKHGPFTEKSLRAMIDEGRLRDGDLVWTQGFPDWKPAIEYFTFPVGPPVPVHQSPISAPIHPNFMAAGGPQPTVMMQPERGALILSLALLGLFVIGPLCLVAWILGAGDLAEMRRGVRDDRGRGATTGGMVVGIVGTILWIAGAAAWIYLASSGSVLL